MSSDSEDRTDLMVFIDLGFILLTGFLIIAETSQKENVPLPREEEEQQNPTEIGITYEVQFNANMDFLVINPREQVEVCSASGIEEVMPCLFSLTDSTPQPFLVLLPRGQAVVQQLVSLLDLCQRYSWRCTIDN